MRRPPPREQPPARRFRRDLPRPEGPFDRLLRRRPERDPAPIIIGGTIAFLAIVILLVVGVSTLLGGGGSDRSSSGQDGREIDFGGVSGRLTSRIPNLPPGLQQLSDYVEFNLDKDVPPISGFALPLREKIEDPAGLGFYTFMESRWQRLTDVKVVRSGRAEGEFNSIPGNLVVLRVAAQPYQVVGSIPPGGSLHGEAQVTIISPRDYSPTQDGSVQGTSTTVPPERTYLLVPTIVGSGEDTAKIVNAILADENLRKAHVDGIVKLVTNSKLDGIDLEYSSVDVELQGEFTEFVTSLADRLGDKRLSLTLPPPTNQRQAYDWKAIGKAADMIKILPIADPVSYWETMPRAISQVVEDVDPSKVMLVLSPYSIEGVGDVTRPIGYLQAMVLAAEAAVREPANPNDIKPGVTVKLVAKNLDEGEGASSLRWDNDAAAVRFDLGGTERRRIIIENSFSAGFKLEIVQAYRLAGLALSDASGQSDVVSDGEKRFGRKTLIDVKKGNPASPTPLITFAPATPVPSPTPSVPATATATPKPTLPLEMGVRVDADGDGIAHNDEQATPGAKVTYYVIIDNDSPIKVNVTSLLDSVFGNITTCKTAGGSPNVVGIELDPDNGDGPGDVDPDGPDAVSCTYEVTAPTESGKEVRNTVTATVQAADGQTGTDFDDNTKFTTK